MKYELIGFNHHNNGIALYKICDSNNFYYKKLSFSVSANEIIKTEHEGYEWFFSQLEQENVVKLIDRTFFELLMPEFPGKKFKSTSTLKGNEYFIERVLNLYIQHWDPNSDIKIHGDFALGNFILDSNLIHLIDWEHFHKAESYYWSFDFIHLLFIALQSQSFKIRYTDAQFLRNCYSQLCHKATDLNRILENPFRNSSKYMRDNSIRFKLNKPIHDKFDLAKTSPLILETLDSIITKL